MQRLEVSGVVRLIYRSLGVKGLKRTKLGLSQENRDKCKPEISTKRFGYQTINEIRINRRNNEVYARENRKATNRSEWAMHTTTCASESPFIGYCEIQRNRRVDLWDGVSGLTLEFMRFLDSFAKRRKSTISFVLSVCLTVRMKHGSYWTDCHEIW